MTDRLDFFLSYFLPTVAILGSLINLLNAVIFSKLDSTTTIYKYLTANSVMDCLMFILSAPTLTRYKSEWYIYTYWFCLYQRVVTAYAVRAIGMMSSLINIKIAIDRYIYLKRYAVQKVNRSSGNIKQVIFIFAFVSAIVTLPNLFYTKIYKLDNLNNDNTSERYAIDLIERVRNDKSYKQKVFIVQNIWSTLNLILMTSFNILIYNLVRKNNTRKFSIQLSYSKKQLENTDTYQESETFRMNINASSSRKRRQGGSDTRTTFMVIWISIIYTIEQKILALGSTLVWILDANSVGYKITMAIIIQAYFVCTILNTISYYVFNKTFAAKLKQILFKFF